MDLVADSLVVDQGAVLDEVPALGLDAFVVVTDIAQRVRLDLVGNDGDFRAAVLVVAALELVHRRETGAGVVGFVAKYAIQFERMADRFVDGQPEVGWVEHQVELAGFHAARLQFLLCLLRTEAGVFNNVIGVLVDHGAAGQLDAVFLLRIHVFVAHAHWGRQAIATAELATGLVDGGDAHRCPDAMYVLVDVRAIGRCEVLLLVDLE